MHKLSTSLMFRRQYQYTRAPAIAGRANNKLRVCKHITYTIYIQGGEPKDGIFCNHILLFISRGEVY